MSQRILAVESATDWLSVAFLEDEDVVASQQSDARMQHAAALLPAIDATLSAAGATLEQVDSFAISTGPGSFTSLRIGLATIKGLGFRRDVRAVGVSTLEAMALSALEDRTSEESTQSREVLALLDARRGEWYAGSWRASRSANGIPENLLAEGLYAPDRISEGLRGPVEIVAPQPAEWLSEFAGGPVEVVRRVEGVAARPSAEWVGRLGRRRIEAGEAMATKDLAARYVRRAEAEAKLLGCPVESGEIADLGIGGESS